MKYKDVRVLALLRASGEKLGPQHLLMLKSSLCTSLNVEIGFLIDGQQAAATPTVNSKDTPCKS